MLFYLIAIFHFLIFAIFSNTKFLWILPETLVTDSSLPIWMGTTPFIMSHWVSSIYNINQNCVISKSQHWQTLTSNLSISSCPWLWESLGHSIWKLFQLHSSFPHFSYPYTCAPSLHSQRHKSRQFLFIYNEALLLHYYFHFFLLS